MRLGYNTNGLAHHRWQDALTLIAEAGYQSVALTIDHHCLNPFATPVAPKLREVQRMLESLRLSCVIETGARFLLDPYTKHEPTLVSPTQSARERRSAFLRTCIDYAATLQADCVSLWSGVVHDAAAATEAWDRLESGLAPVLDYAAARAVRIGFEPEPGMLVATMSDYAELIRRCDSPWLGLTLDVGHVHCIETCSIPECIATWSPRLWNVHIEDMQRGVHEHLRFGDGTMEFSSILAALVAQGYGGGVHVELSRHSHCAPEMLRESLAFLRAHLPAGANTSG